MRRYSIQQGLFHDLEFDTTHTATCKEGVAFSNRAIRFEKVGFKVHIKEVATDTLYGVAEGKNMDALAILNVGALASREYGIRE